MFHITYHFDDGGIGSFFTNDCADYAEVLVLFQAAVERCHDDQSLVSVCVTDDTYYVHEFFALLFDCNLIER